MHRQNIYVVCAEGEEELAEKLAQPLREAGYGVTHDGTVAVGESLIGEAAKALASGSPIVLCATTRAAGSQWAHHIVNASHADGPAHVFVVKMEKQAYVEHLALKAKIAKYCDNPAEALRDLLDALAKHYPPVILPVTNTTPSKETTTVAGREFLDQLTECVTFDIEALQRFRSELREEVAIRYPVALSAWEFLDRAGLRVDGRLTRTGALLFAKNPTLTSPTATVKCARYHGTDRGESRDRATYEDTVPAQIIAARQFVADHVRRGEAPSANQAQAITLYDYPMVAVREIIANALVHRDYASTDTCVHVRLYSDRLEISSPGTWLGCDLSAGNEYDLADLEGQSIKRNFRLAHVLSWIKMVEGEGSGIPSALRDCQAMQSPSPTVVQGQGFVTVRLRSRIHDHELPPRPDAMVEFCAGLGRLQQGSGLDRAVIARRVGYSRSQLYEILAGQISRPPEWDRLVEPLVRVCTRDDERAVAAWRRRHDVLVAVYSELTRQDRQGGTPIEAGVGTARVVPMQLPPDTTHFVGRAEELRYLSTLLDTTIDGTTAAGGGSTSVVISAVSGTAGVGKTALALRWAHRVRGEFPDGQLYVNLRGYDPDQPLSATDALARFLRALGVAGADIPPEVDERAASYRSLLDGRRILIVLDNASSVEQVRPLLPGTPSVLVVVTSRDSLAGLVARDGARRLDLDLLPPEDAVVLLGALIGERVAAEPDAAAALAGQCARLPLALRVAAELAAARPATSLAGLVAELADEQRRLELLGAGGDPRTAVRAVLSWSYQHLPAEAARAFRLLGLHPGPDLDPYAAAALTHTSVEQVQHLLDLLARAHLIQPTSPGRYGMHDLLRAYATYLAGIEEGEQERRAALTRLFDHYLATAGAAMDTLQPAEQHRRPRILPPATPTPPVADPATARAWLDAERVTLTAVCAHTAAHGWPEHTTRLASTLFRYLEVGGHYPEAVTAHIHALHAARHTDDRAAEAHALGNLGVIYWRQGRYQQAAEHHQHALTLGREIGHQADEARALDNLGLVYRRQDHSEWAVDHHQQALAMCREIGHRVGEAYALGNIGLVYFHQGRYQQAAEHHQQALTLFREIGHRTGEASALNGVGETHHAIGHHEKAHNHHTAALTLATEIGDRYEQARAHSGLAYAHHAAGDPDQARYDWHQALTLYTDLGVPDADDVRAQLSALDHTPVDEARTDRRKR